MSTAIIFGGTGFIGTFFAIELIANKIVSQVILADICPIDKARFGTILETHVQNGSVKYLTCDVRKSIFNQLNLSDKVSLIANFAAVHREPGHNTNEYYETNLLGARNICDWATKIKCDRILFTSTIAVYGPSFKAKDEDDIPSPISPYGNSKLVAEEIHKSWLNNCNDRRLVIVRPGVVFGPGENGNVTRLIRAVLRGYFVYTGNRNTRKAAIYVKELTNALLWSLRKFENTKSITFNMTFSPPPSLEDFVTGIAGASEVSAHKFSVPYKFLLLLSYIAHSISRIFSMNFPLNPTRIRKIATSNNIIPKYLEDHDYEYKYTLNSALEDWKNEAPSEWKK